jgi:CheY-like chemotaxis protein
MLNDDTVRAAKVVLLVEDEAPIRRMLRMILETSGYVVLDAGDGVEGLALCRNHPGPIDVLLSDVNMPRLGGHELAAGAREMRPELKVLLMSALSEESVFERPAVAGAAFLQKPFSSVALERTLRATLDSQPHSVPA